ncbi:hypothetical protein [Deinococcus sp. Leaf326]|uniref:hypothetical protein n=1 Tax=Deinococcus sp. Leaf326 TaxID=1736338 RepID=UPI0012E1F065|nr:hypothetical protein [Deinococcus sp. Leaf326]
MDESGVKMVRHQRLTQQVSQGLAVAGLSDQVVKQGGFVGPLSTVMGMRGGERIDSVILILITQYQILGKALYGAFTDSSIPVCAKF